MRRVSRNLNRWLTAALVAAWLPLQIQAKSYSSGGGHSYSSSSHSSSSGGSHSFSSGSHSFSSGSSSRSSSSGSSRSSSSGSSFSHSSSGSGGTSTHSSGGGSSSGSTRTGTPSSSTRSSGGSTKSFNSGSGKSYSSGSGSGSGSNWSDNDRRSYTSGKSYTADSGRIYSSSKSSEKGASSLSAPKTTTKAAPSASSDSSPSSFSYDTAAAHARKEEASKNEFTRFKESQTPRAPPIIDSTRNSSPNDYNAKPPPIATSGGSYRTRTYIPDTTTIRTRPTRYYSVFYPYYSQPVVFYRDTYDSFFWWWLLDRSLDDRAYWAYNHRYDMDPARYEALMERDQALEARVNQLEAQQVPRDPNYTPPGIDRDLMYSDNYVQHNYSNRPTRVGNIAFFVFAVPLVIGFVVFFIWLIWFKRWQPAT